MSIYSYTNVHGDEINCLEKVLNDSSTIINGDIFYPKLTDGHKEKAAHLARVGFRKTVIDHAIKIINTCGNSESAELRTYILKRI